MAYEYEHDVISELKQIGVDYQSNSYLNMSIEVEEVYFKAKTLNKIINIIKSGRSLGADMNSEIVLRAIEHELKYTEDKQND